jgi:hypothetical protein
MARENSFLEQLFWIALGMSYFRVHVLSACNSNVISHGKSMRGNGRKFHPPHTAEVIDHRNSVPEPSATDNRGVITPDGLFLI